MQSRGGWDQKRVQPVVEVVVGGREVNETEIFATIET